VRLCMFHPVDHPMERGWVGRIDGEHVTHLAAQSLQSFFTGGGSAREHAVYPLAGVRLLAPVLHPPSVRVFENETSFEFANPAAIVGPGAEIARRPDLVVLLRVAAVMGADAEIGGFTLAADWRDGSAAPPKDRDFALGLGPVVVTPEELDSAYRATVLRVDGDEYRAFLPPFDWIAARDIAADGTRLHPGDVLAGPPAAHAVGDGGSGEAELEAPSLGTLRQTVVAR
jgi:hypothetical protein